MNNKIFFTYIFNILFVFIIITCLLLINIFGSKYQPPPIFVSREESALRFNNQLVKIFNFGQIRLFSSLLWINTLMESDTEVYKRSDANSWMYLRFDLMTDIEPQFFVAYLFGGQYLSIVKSDKIGALNIYQKGLQEFPESYDLNSLIAFHYYFELQQTEKAILHYKKAAESPHAPETFRHLVAKMAYEIGNFDLAYNVIKELYSENKEHDFLGPKYREMLYAVKTKRDLECLNAGKQECDHVDLDGEQYVLTNGLYSARKTYKEIKIYK